MAVSSTTLAEQVSESPGEQREIDWSCMLSSASSEYERVRGVSCDCRALYMTSTIHVRAGTSDFSTQQAQHTASRQTGRCA